MINLSETEAKGVRQASPAQFSFIVDDARVTLGARELATTPHNDDEIIVHGTNKSVSSSKSTKKKLVPIVEEQLNR